jgi:signal transduction histidine kinase
VTRRLVLSYLAVTIVVLALFEIPLAVFFQQREQDRLSIDAERDATVLATIYEDALEKGTAPDPVPAQEYFVESGVRTVVVDVDGISVIDTGNDTARDFSTRPEIAEALTGQRTTGTRYSETLGTELLYVAVPVASGGVVHGALRLTIDTHEVTERVYAFWVGLAVIGVIILVVMAGIGTLIARSVTRPVRRLRADAERFAHGDLTPREVTEPAPPELAALETTMHEMARRLDDLIERQRAFVADASHQLRTPLTALRLRLENLESETSNASLAVELGAAIDETTRLGALVDDLLQLARSETTPEIVAVDLVETLRDRVDTWTATADQHDVTIELDTPDVAAYGAAVSGGVEQVLDNLFDNAIRAAPPFSSINVALAAGQDRHRITISDQGLGIDDVDKESALTRFWRADTSMPGTGLGLAICEAVVRLGGGGMSLDDNTPTGLRVTVTLVATSPAELRLPAEAGRQGRSTVES